MSTATASKNIPVERWGKDHWSTLAFIEVLCVDYKGLLSDKHRRSLRCNPKTHPASGYWLGKPRWEKSYGTRLKGFYTDNGKPRPQLQLQSHDDWDCIEDMEAAGVLENNGSAINPMFKLTEQGLRYCAALRRFKANGGTFAKFDPAKHL